MVISGFVCLVLRALLVSVSSAPRGPSPAPCDLATLAPLWDQGLDTFPAWGGGAMKLRQPREAMPLSVWIAFALLACGTIAYLTGLLIVEDILAYFGAKK